MPSSSYANKAARDAERDFASLSDFDVDRYDDEATLEPQSVFVEPKPKSKKIREGEKGSLKAVVDADSILNTKAQPLIQTKKSIMCLEPKDTDSAGYFLRNFCRAVTTHFSDRDELRVTLKGTDLDEDKFKHQIVVDITVENLHERETKYIECANRIWLLWAENEEQKL